VLLKKLLTIGLTPYRRVLSRLIKKKYKIMSAIFYEGEEMNRHYIYMLRADKKSEWWLF